MVDETEAPVEEPVEETTEEVVEETTKEAAPEEEAAEEEAPEEEAEESEEEDTEEQADERKMYKATCSDCGQECEVPFEPVEGKPVRCKDCYMKSRQNRGGGGRRNFGGGQNRQMYDATCSDCGQACQVPFKPTEGKPIRCRDCYKKHMGY